jgi:hypothetical protein
MADNKHEHLASWFFRLNGCLTIPNFVVHPEAGCNQRTDADLLAVRFPHHLEKLWKPLKDHDFFTAEKMRLQVFFVEVKAGACAINDTWADPKRRNVNTVVSAIGFAPADAVDKIANSIYTTGQYSDNAVLARFVCIGGKHGKLAPLFSAVRQILFPEILHFIHERFHDNDKPKSSHDQWDAFGWHLYEEANKYLKPEEFSYAVLNAWPNP